MLTSFIKNIQKSMKNPKANEVIKHSIRGRDFFIILKTISTQLPNIKLEMDALMLRVSVNLITMASEKANPKLEMSIILIPSVKKLIPTIK